MFDPGIHARVAFALDAASLAKLGYRELQTECKRRGLLAIGRREELIGRLAPEAPA